MPGIDDVATGSGEWKIRIAGRPREGTEERYVVLEEPVKSQGGIQFWMLNAALFAAAMAARQSATPRTRPVRAAEPLDNWQADLSGPGKLTRAFRIKRSDNGLDLTGNKLFLLDDPTYHPRMVSSKRVGVDYAGEWKDAPLRFFDAHSTAVSRPRF